MFVSSYTNIVDESNKSKNTELLEKSGIIDARRIIHIFYDQNNPQTCKVIQINISITRGTHVLFDKTFMNRHNGSLSFVAVYAYDCQLSTVCKTVKDMFMHGKLSLIAAKRCDRETDYDNDFTRSEAAQLYSKIFSNYHVSDYVDSRVLVNPKYYTQEHEYHVTGDYNPNGMMDDIYQPNLSGYDIVDSNTELYQQSPRMFKTVSETLFNDSIRTNYSNKRSYIDSAADTITDMNFVLGCDNMVNGGIFVYDSQLGMNFKNASILCKNYMTKQNSTLEFETFLISLESIGNRLENEFGSIRLMYSPSLIGSKCRIIYKDMANSVSDDGMMNSKSSKDSSCEITETISEHIESDSSLFAHNEVYEGIRHDDMLKEKIISYNY